MPKINLFLSTVSAEFRSYRNALRHYLDRPNVTVKVQEDFIATGTETLDMLDEYISQCDAVIHLIGNMTGAMAQDPSLTLIRERYPDLAERFPPLRPFLELGDQALSYTQWEAWLALYHHKMLIIAVPVSGANRDEQYAFVEEQHAHQQSHLTRLASIERYPSFSFKSNEQLAAEILRSKLHDILARAGTPKKFVNLPFVSIGALFKGRANSLKGLSDSLGVVLDTADHAPINRVLYGLGGVGKTRLALEYAWQHGEDYSARLLIVASSDTALQQNLAGLCQTLELEERHETDQTKQRDAVLKWLNQHPGWLLILDNVDTEAAAIAAEGLIPQLWGGHLLVTSRLTNWSASLTVFPVDTLSMDAATEFLLERTNAKRRKQTDDDTQARILADTLDGLALALEQAGAYIAQRSLTFNGYLEEYKKQSDKVLAWHDPRLMQYPQSVAVTWQASFDQLGESARQLLQHLAWLSFAPIPESLLDVPIDDSEEEIDAFSALAELESYSLVTRATDSPSFSVHRLVQKVTQLKDPEHVQLNETLRWINAAFVCPIQDVRNWPVLNSLQPHVQKVIKYADKAGIATPVTRLMNDLGLMYLAKSLYKEAEPLFRRALEIDEASFGKNHPRVAIRLNNLALLFKDTNRLDDAEPLLRRALTIDETNFGKNHPNVARDLNNLALLLKATNRLPEAESLMREALVIFITSLGTKHPYSIATRGNYILLFQELGQTEDEIRKRIEKLFEFAPEENIS